jgi:dTDP-4-amino-4,6-dideoxygalactose transaminase
MNEFEAAMGLCVLDDIEKIKHHRKNVINLYIENLKGTVGFQEQCLDSTENYSYFPVVFKSEDELLRVQQALNEQKIFPRRYFYPSLDPLSYIDPKQECISSRGISTRILCLPVYVELDRVTQENIINILKDSLS